MKIKIQDSAVPVYADAECTGTRMAELKAGDFVRIEERSALDGWVRIQLSDGRSGYCRQPFKGKNWEEAPTWSVWLGLFLTIVVIGSVAMPAGRWFHENLRDDGTPAIILLVPVLGAGLAFHFAWRWMAEAVAEAQQKRKETNARAQRG